MTSSKYILRLACDANFRLKRKEKGTREDPELAPGWAYFVEDSAYQEELSKHQDVIEVGSIGLLKSGGANQWCFVDNPMRVNV